jgi:carboxyl-terminal processing protease
MSVLRSRRLRVALPALLVVSSVLACARRPGPQAAPATGRNGEAISTDLALLTFDSAWRRIRDTHYDTAMRGLDWNAVRDTLRPRAARAATLGELRGTINEMLERLGESHYGLLPQEIVDAFDPATLADTADDAGDREDAGSADTAGAADPAATAAERPKPPVPAGPGDVGIDLRLVGRAIVVARVEEGSPAAIAGVRTGWAVDSVGRYTAAFAAGQLAAVTTEAEQRALGYRLPQVVRALFAGDAGDDVTAAFTDGDGARHLVTMTRRPLPGIQVRFGNLPAFNARVEHQRIPLDGGGCAGVIRFNIWMPPIAQPLDEAMDSVRACRGVVLDVRGNPGGVAGMVMGFGGYFLDTPVPLGIMRQRGTELRFAVNPRLTNMAGRAIQPYAGPVAVLVDPLSASTSEIFAAGMQAVGRARVFGDTTARQALPALMTRLPTGDVLLYVVADFVDPNGRRVEGRGAVPDETVPLRREALLQGRDEPLDAALRWIIRTPEGTKPRP